MLPQIVCLSCGYHRTWPTLLEALADGRHHAEHHPPEPALPESVERRCPYCKSQRIGPVGQVMAAGRIIKVEHRCEVCGTAFFFVRTAPPS
jgi:hypothetical protein